MQLCVKPPGLENSSNTQETHIFRVSVRTHAIPERTNPESAKECHLTAQWTTINVKIEERKPYITDNNVTYDSRQCISSLFHFFSLWKHWLLSSFNLTNSTFNNTLYSCYEQYKVSCSLISVLYWVWLGWLIFFIAAHMVLYFGFVTKTVVITHQCFVYCWPVLAQHQGSLSFSLCPPQWEGWGCGREWKGI